LTPRANLEQLKLGADSGLRQRQKNWQKICSCTVWHKRRVRILIIDDEAAPGTPMSDLTNAGDSFHTNSMLDNVLVAPNAVCDAGAGIDANGHDLKDPMLSPIYGDMSGFPPTILTTGTRDLLLSGTVRVHRKLRQAGVEALLQVYEAQSHAQFMRDTSAPETKEAFEEIAQFFDKHLGCRVHFVLFVFFG